MTLHLADSSSTTEPTLGCHRERPEGERAPDAVLVERLRAGDELAFARVVGEWSGTMVRVARTWVSTTASAEEVVQDTWLAVLRGLNQFEGRSSLRTWVFQILANRAKTRAVREYRTVPMSMLGVEDDEPAVDPDRFEATGDRAGAWTRIGAPQAWVDAPEAQCLSGELRRRLRAALDELPERQRTVVMLRDVQGFSSDEVCGVLDVSAENQRVLLHRGRAKLRTALETYYRGDAAYAGDGAVAG